MKGRVQLFRYFLICMFNLALNFILLKILVEQAHVYAVLAQFLTTGIVILFSYLPNVIFPSGSTMKWDDDERPSRPTN